MTNKIEDLRYITPEELKVILEDDGYVGYNSWIFNRGCMNCYEGCCFEDFKDIDEAINRIVDYVEDDTFTLYRDIDGKEVEELCQIK